MQAVTLEASPELPELTPAGFAFAASVAEDSIVARVALGGYGDSWPDSHVRTAIETCNAKGSPDGICVIFRLEDVFRARERGEAPSD